MEAVLTNLRPASRPKAMPSLKTKNKLMSHYSVTAVVAVLHQIWPVATGATFGQIVAQAEQWRYPWVAAVVTGALVQVLIFLLRSWFSERRDLLQTMRAMLGEQREYLHGVINNEKQERHDMANRAAKAELKLRMVEAGVPLSKIRDADPLYPERSENSDQ